jgi:hypothetical protein
MPFELEDVEDVDVPVLAAPPDELELWVGWLVDLVDEPELDELDPHAATPNAASTSRAAARRRAGLVIVAFINRSFGVRPE